MLMELELELSENRIKPVFNTVTGYDKKVSCLFDTGATMPVWCKSRSLFNVIFPDAEIYTGNCILSGFGKGFELVDVYRIPEFCLTDGLNSVVFKNLLVATSFDRDFGCDLILSYTMFSHMDYSILNRNRACSVLRLTCDRDTYYVSPVLSTHASSRVLKRISVFSNENDADS